ncbi:choline dehydrogenase [Amaricoccus macauensis]|uniref:Choline dehydrogenase n=1 Tax=Amaricoccus macauensis TaxID=57001 RepID=A0A840SYN4_9RHOB|nr:choline dehydrogenase [Amaricoccus macauensis]
MAHEVDREFDYVIVGGGSAGCVLAARLTEDPHVRVLLLEAGGNDSHPYHKSPLGYAIVRYRESSNWSYHSDPDPTLCGRRVFLPRGRVLGGSSTINGTVYVRGHPRDFDEWRQLGLDGWSYADVLPYFKRSQRHWRGESFYYGGSGPIEVVPVDTEGQLYEELVETAMAAGHPYSEDINAEHPEGVNRIELTVSRGRRASTSQAFLNPVRHRPNLSVRVRAQASEILFEGRRAVGVRCLRQGQVEEVRAAREVVLCGGTYNSAQLLLLSGVGPADDLLGHGIRARLDLPGVGRNLSEHARLGMDFLTRDMVGLNRMLRLDRMALAAARWALTGKGVLGTQALSGSLMLRTRVGLERPDIQVLFVPALEDQRVWFPLVRPARAPGIAAVVQLMHPESRGQLTLRSADPLAPPRIQLNLLDADADLASLRAGIRATREIYATNPMAGLISRELVPGPGAVSDAELDAFCRSAATTAHHPVGTCSMGTGPMAVVDTELRVRGIEGLRVVDASVMPTVPGGNTNAPTIMIAEKAADMMRGRRLPPAELPKRQDADLSLGG